MTELNSEPAGEFRQPTVGIIGGGQLGRMIALAGYPLGLRFRFLDPAGLESPAGQIAGCVAAAYDNAAAVVRFAQGLDVLTYEFENVPIEPLELVPGVPVLPPIPALAVAQDRLQEKQLFQHIGIATPKFAGVSMRAELDAALAYLGTPAILKTRHMGYDGRGQFVLRDKSQAEEAWQSIGRQPCILEQRIEFDEEVSIIAARARAGEIAYYPLAHNTHREGILRVSWIDPALERAGGEPLAEQARAAVRRIMEQFDYVGVLALELFVKDGRIIANEIAPRVHNSGHWSIEASPCSQFENHLRAVLGLPLGETFGEKPAAMVNLVGSLPRREDVLRAVPDARLHYYGKAPRPNRKVGHVTILADSCDALHVKIRDIGQLISEPPAM